MTRLYINKSAGEYSRNIAQIDQRKWVMRRRHDLQGIMKKRSSLDLNKGYWIGRSYHTTWESLLARHPLIAAPPNPNFSGGQDASN